MIELYLAQVEKDNMFGVEKYPPAWRIATNWIVCLKTELKNIAHRRVIRRRVMYNRVNRYLDWIWQSQMEERCGQDNSERRSGNGETELKVKDVSAGGRKWGTTNKLDVGGEKRNEEVENYNLCRYSFRRIFS